MSGQGLFGVLKNIECLHGVDYIDTIVRNTIYKARHQGVEDIATIIHHDQINRAELDSFWKRYGEHPEDFYDRILYN